jgi:hypothetical protein
VLLVPSRNFYGDVHVPGRTLGRSLWYSRQTCAPTCAPAACPWQAVHLIDLSSVSCQQMSAFPQMARAPRDARSGSALLLVPSARPLSARRVSRTFLIRTRDPHIGRRPRAMCVQAFINDLSIDHWGKSPTPLSWQALERRGSTPFSRPSYRVRAVGKTLCSRPCSLE